MPAVDEPWTWRTLTLECPQCLAVIQQEAANNHVSWHWLTNTITKTVEI